MGWLEIDANTHVQADALVKVDFQPDQASPLGEHAKLFIVKGEDLAQAGEPVTTIAGLQKLRELVGGGTGSTSWILVRKKGAMGDQENSFINLDRVAEVVFATAPDGAIARLKARNGSDIGEVHHPIALQRVRQFVEKGRR
jgi:hypothetical protein